MDDGEAETGACLKRVLLAERLKELILQELSRDTLARVNDRDLEGKRLRPGRSRQLAQADLDVAVLKRRWKDERKFSDETFSC